jgi:peptidyl-prolyl cis-trans isomerase NIMA-interacting 1
VSPRGAVRSASVIVAVAVASLACDDKKASAPPPAPAAIAPAAAPATSEPAPSASAPAAPSASADHEAPAAVTAQHVLVAYKGAKNAPGSVKRTKADAKKRADEIADKAKGGADFSALVAEYSDDPGSKERMGSVGKFTRDKMVAPFSDAAFKLRVGEVSGAVETPFGFHVIKRNQ